MQLVVRFGPGAREGLDVHVLGAQHVVRRKSVQGVRRSLVMRCDVGSSTRMFGVSAADLAGRIAPLEDLWGEAPTRMLRERIAEAADLPRAIAILEEQVALRTAAAAIHDEGARLVAEAARRLATAGVRSVAADLDVSERHLRRLFHARVGLSPKRFARVARFDRALRLATQGAESTWADIAAAAGYCDQAHLIDDFHLIAGATPSAFLREFADAR